MKRNKVLKEPYPSPNILYENIYEVQQRLVFRISQGLCMLLICNDITTLNDLFKLNPNRLMAKEPILDWDYVGDIKRMLLDPKLINWVPPYWVTQN